MVSYKFVSAALVFHEMFEICEEARGLYKK
jgi:hypothetical protein